MSADEKDAFLVVGIGTPTGGIEALETFCSHMPQDLNRPQPPVVADMGANPVSKPAISDLVHAFLMQEDMPPAAVINSASEVVYMTGKIDDFLRLRAGLPSLDLFALLDPTIHTAVKAAVQSVTMTRRSMRLNRVPTCEGKLIDVLARPVIISNQDSGFTIISFIRFSDDRSLPMSLADRPESEQLRVRKETARVNEAKNEFIAHMSHELRTPLNSILGFAEILQSGKLDDDQKEYVQSIKRSGRHLMQAVDDIIGFSKIEANCLTLDESEFPVHEVINEVIRTYDFALAKEAISVHTDKVAQDIVVRADRQRFFHAIINITGNSIKSVSKGGRIEFRLTVSDSGQPVLTVADDGVGIPESDLARFFERFKPTNPAGASTRGGSAIGLSLVKSMIEIHGGNVRVKLPGLAGRGVSFEVVLPSERRILPE